MALIKDGIIYRTPEEQLKHLTEKHLEQVSLNKNFSEKIQELSVASNLGGFNIVRTAFQTKNSYSIVNIYGIEELLNSTNVNDFVVFNSYNVDDIPAYGFVTENKEINLIFAGDYAEERLNLKADVRNLGISFDVTVSMVYDEATSLFSLNANDYKKQVFTVLEDTKYGCKTQYVSYDINGDDVYNFVYIGSVDSGKNGSSFYSANPENFEFIKQQMQSGDLVVLMDRIPELGFEKGDVYKFISSDNLQKEGSLLGPIGLKGDKGEKGEQGIQGIQGVQGIQGEKGEQGEKGKDGDGLDIKTGILNNPSELPSFSSAEVGDAYRIINTSGSVVSYDLYFKASNGTDWDIQPNWGGVKGDKGEKGDTGLQGIQGVQGLQGEQGLSGLTGTFKRYANSILPYDISTFLPPLGAMRIIFYNNKDSLTGAFSEITLNGKVYIMGEEIKRLEIVIDQNSYSHQTNQCNYFITDGVSFLERGVCDWDSNTIKLSHGGPDVPTYTIETFP